MKKAGIKKLKDLTLDEIEAWINLGMYEINEWNKLLIDLKDELKKRKIK